MKTLKDLLAEKPSPSLKGDTMFPQRTPKDASKETQRSDKEKLADIRKDREKDSVKKRTDAINKQKDTAITKEKEKAAKKISGLGEELVVELVVEENSPGGAIMKKTFKELRVLEEGTSARQRGEVQSPRSQKEYDAITPKDKKIVDRRTKNA
ncbi:MAG: hypothetical protein GY915_03685, partial [bacterium]|nr:hypothetical protein [bacterium]